MDFFGRGNTKSYSQIAMVHVRGFSLEPPQCRDILSYLIRAASLKEFQSDATHVFSHKSTCMKNFPRIT